MEVRKDRTGPNPEELIQTGTNCSNTMSIVQLQISKTNNRFFLKFFGLDIDLFFLNAIIFSAYCILSSPR
jgi:hypothetical protein